MKLIEEAPRQPIHVMVFGDSKSGKSTLVGGLAEIRNLIWISLDGGHTVLRKLDKAWQENIDLIRLPDVREFPIGIDTAKKLFRGDKLNLCHMHGLNNCSVCTKNTLPFSPYSLREIGTDTVVVLDHLTSVSDSCMALITRERPNSKAKSGEDIGFYKPELDDYGALKFNMDALMKSIQNAPFNVVCIAQSAEVEMEDGKHKLVPSVGSREFGRTVGQYFDHIVYCDVVNKGHKYGSSTVYSNSILTGSRTDIAIEKLETPSLKPFFEGQVASKGVELQGEIVAARVLTGAGTGVAVGSSGASSASSASANNKAAEILAKLKEGKK